jgi:alpha-amylase
VDHFYDVDAKFDAVKSGEAMERGDFAGGLYDARLRKNADRIQVLLTKQGNAWGVPLKITKGVTLEGHSSVLEIAYMVEQIPPDAVFLFGVEFNFAGMPPGVDDRYFYGRDRTKLGQLGSELDLHDVTDLALADEWLGLDVQFQANRPTNFWTFPIGTVSQSESGIELVYQSVVVEPHWWIRGDKGGRWSVVMRLALDTSMAERRQQPEVAVA